MDSFPKQIEIGLRLPNIHNQTIFFAVLNWGLGHATRSIPIIDHLIQNGNQVILFSDGEGGNLLQETFPHLRYHTLSSYNVRYDSKYVLIGLLGQFLKAPKLLRQENMEVSYYYDLYKPSIIVSDNRYGCHHPDCLNYLITHQLLVISQNYFFRNLTKWFANNLLRKFSEIWIPDFKELGLSNAMSSAQIDVPKRYIGFCAPKVSQVIHSEVLILLSGPESRRSLVEAMYHKAIKGSTKKIVFIAGNYLNPQQKIVKDNITYFSRLNYKEVLSYIAGADKIVCRSGYTTLIDLYCLGKKNIVCVPTADQPEQEYLADYWTKKGWISMITENEIELKLPNILEST
ncbi:MAG: glycosyltransferase [Chitinophagales bacterium]